MRGRRCTRVWDDCRADYEAVRATWPQPEVEQDIARGEQRFAAEAALAEMRDELVPTWVRERAINTLSILARG